MEIINYVYLGLVLITMIWLFLVSKADIDSMRRNEDTFITSLLGLDEKEDKRKGKKEDGKS